MQQVGRIATCLTISLRRIVQQVSKRRFSYPDHTDIYYFNFLSPEEDDGYVYNIGGLSQIGFALILTEVVFFEHKETCFFLLPEWFLNKIFSSFTRYFHTHNETFRIRFVRSNDIYFIIIRDLRLFGRQSFLFSESIILFNTTYYLMRYIRGIRSR